MLFHLEGKRHEHKLVQGESYAEVGIDAHEVHAHEVNAHESDDAGKFLI